MARSAAGPQLAVRTWLIDTGPLVAYLDRGDPAHDAVARTIDAFSGRFATTGAVVTEAMHLLAEARDGPMLLAELVGSADVQIVECTNAEQLLTAATLMRKYADTPMDFADATLVLLAGEIGVVDILTLDRRGFSVYKLTNGKRFRLVL